mmetsp:Transcript_15241/g.37876  ORF Transcript_15241/g.37876 Transcript_15241/m.37876 type:complete len:320 (-) Transcript_15241:326-1285(-)
MSDGGQQYDGLCDELNSKAVETSSARKFCFAATCPPVEDRWHPWPFFRRFYDAAMTLSSVEYLVMLEPDNTVHAPFLRDLMPHDAGGIRDHNGDFSQALVSYVESLARKLPGKGDFTWEYKGTGLAGGSYYKRKAIIDAFSDAASEAIDWGKMFKLGPSAAVYSSDFAMPLALAARGLTYKPWAQVRQAYGDHTDPTQPTGERVAVLHYNRDIKGGKPSTRFRVPSRGLALAEELPAATPLLGPDWLEIVKNAAKSVKPPKPAWAARAPNICQLCWNRAEYARRFGSNQCLPDFDFVYTKEMLPKDARPGVAAAVQRMR